MLLREVSLQQHGFLVFVILPLEHKSCRKIIGVLLLLLSKNVSLYDYPKRYGIDESAVFIYCEPVSANICNSQLLAWFKR